MPTPPSPEPTAPRRSWISLGIKAALAIAALTGLAQWIPGRDTGSLRREAFAPAPMQSDLADPPMTGSIGARARPAAVAASMSTQPGAFDQRGLASLISQNDNDAAKTAKKRVR